VTKSYNCNHKRKIKRVLRSIVSRTRTSASLGDITVSLTMALSIGFCGSYQLPRIGRYACL